MGEIAFDARWLHELGVQSHGVSITKMYGDAMSPGICDGDFLMIDHNDGGQRLRDGIYVVEVDAVIMVKRISMGPMRGCFSLLCDNPHYPNWLDIDLAQVGIVGRVLWVGRTFK